MKNINEKLLEMILEENEILKESILINNTKPELEENDLLIFSDKVRENRNYQLMVLESIKERIIAEWLDCYYMGNSNFILFDAILRVYEEL